MNSIRSKCIGIVSIGMVGVSAFAAPITWQTPVTVLNNDAQISTTYSYRWAYTGGSAATVNTVAFAAGLNNNINNANIQVSGFTGANNNIFNGGTSGTWNTLSAGYKSILTGAVYGGTGAATITLKNLAVGGSYLIQIWINDSRTTGSGRTASVTSSGGNSVTVDYNDTNALGGVGQLALGTFVADAATQTFTITGSSSSQLNAIQLREEGGSLAWDAGASPDVNWVTASNWDPDTTPVAGDSVTFTNTGLKASGAISCQLPSAVDTTCYDLSIGGTASYGSNWHTFDLGGKTLTLRGNVTVGNPGVGYTHNSRMTNGNLVVNGTTLTLIRAGNNTTDGGAHTLDWSGLTSLTAINLTTLAVASEAQVRYGSGTWTLPGGSNTLKSTTFNYGWGDTGSRINSKTINLNGETSIYADTLNMAGGYNTGTVKMQFGGLGAKTLTLRNKAGTGRMNINLSYRAYNGTSTSTTGIMDFSGGTVDAMINTLTMSKNTSDASRAGNSHSSFIMSAGTVDVSTVSLCPDDVNVQALSNPTIDIRGGTFKFGTFTVTTEEGTKQLLLKEGTFSSSSSAAKTVSNLTTIQFGDVTPKTVTLGTSGTGALTLSAATLLVNNAVTLNTVVDTTLNNTLSGGGALTKSGDATLTLKGASASYTGTTTLEGGRLVIAATNAIPTASDVILTAGTLKVANAVTQEIASLTATSAGVLELPYDCDGALTIRTSLGGIVKISVSGVSSWNTLNRNIVYPLVVLAPTCGVAEGTVFVGDNVPAPWKIVTRGQGLALQYLAGTMIRFI
jgi:autotransporter-associated beta strand protein